MKHVESVLLMGGMVLAICSLIGCTSEITDEEYTVSSSDPAEVVVDLTKFFNNQAFKAGAKNKGGFDGWGNAYPVGRMPKRQGGITFAVANPKRASANNVVADGQTIAVTPGNYSTLCVVGSATNRNTEVDLTLDCDSGQKTAKLQLTDWCSKAAFKEAVYTEFANRVTPGGPDEIACRIWTQKVPLDDGSTLKAIILPKNGNIHIFAMTLITQ